MIWGMRFLGIDYGLRRTGLAIGESEVGMALPFEMFEGLPDGQLAEAIGALVKREGVEAIVIGLPLHANGAVSQQSELTERFIKVLVEKVGAGMAVHRFSEHLTSHDSEGKLAGHFTRMQKRARVDALAAARILQDFMDHEGGKRV